MVADFAAQIANGSVFVAEQANDSIGGFIVFFSQREHMFLENVAVHTAAAGQGLGKALISYCEDSATAAGLGSVELYTNEKMTTNLTMYPHLGYTEFDRREEAGFNRVYFRKHVSLPGTGADT